MLKKNFVLPGIIVAVSLLLLAILYYPGGSRNDPMSIGYDWTNNYISNLFEPKAINGQENTSRPWAIAGMFFLSISFGIFFVRFSNKIAIKSAASVIKYAGVGAVAAAFLTVTPLHDLMVIIASTLALLSFFYITVFVFKTRLHFLKFLAVLCLLLFYGCDLIYFTRTYMEILPVMQKASLLVDLSWIVSLEYGTQKEDFQHIKKVSTH